MSVFYVLNLVLACLLTVWPYWFSRLQLRLSGVNPFLITMVMALPVEAMKLIGGPLVLIENGLFDPGYQFALLMSNVQWTCQWLGAVTFLALFRTLRMTRKWRSGASELDTRKAGVAAVVCIGLSIFCWTLLATSEFGLLAWLSNPREGYQLHRTGAGHWFALMITFLSAGMLFAHLAKPTPAAIMLKTPIFVGLAYFAGSKGVMLAFFTTSMVMLSLLKWKPLPRVMLLGIPPIFGLLAFNLSLALSDALTLQSLLEYFDYYKNAAMYYGDFLRGQTSYFFGEIALTSYAGYVPRALWPDKPVVYGSLLVNEIYYPGQAELTNTPAFGAAVEYFADFGVPGVALSGLLGTQALTMAFAAHVLFNNEKANLRRPTVAVVAAVTLQFVPTFGLYFPGLLYGLLLIGLLLAFRSFRRHAGRRAPSGDAVAT